MKSTLFVLVAALLLTQYGCRDHSSSPEGNGSIVGRIILFDSSQNILSDYSGIKVTIDGSTRTTLTDSSGYWQFSNLDEGTYNVTATKEGFGTYHWYEQMINNGRVDVATVALARMPDKTPSVTAATWNLNFPEPTIVFSGDYDGAPDLEVAAYCDLDSTTLPSDSHLAIFTATSNSGGQIFSFGRTDLLAAGARPGQTLYLSVSYVFVKGLGYRNGYNTSFLDPMHNYTTRWASTGPKSNVTAIQMP